MTHRLLSSKRWSQHNFKRLAVPTPSCSWSMNGGSGQRVRPFSLFCVNQLHAVAEQKQRCAHQRTVAVGTGFSSTIFSTFRPQSTTPDIVAADDPITRDALLKKRKRFRTKFAELIQMNNAGLVTHGKASVKKLKHNQLTSFINRADIIAVAATIPDGIGAPASRPQATTYASSSPTSAPPISSLASAKVGQKPEYIRGKKLALIEMGPRFVQRFELTEEEMPFLFVGKKLVRFERGSVEVQQIVDSYIAFKELSGESEDAMASDDGGEYIEIMQTKRSALRQPNFTLDDDLDLDLIVRSSQAAATSSASIAAATNVTLTKGHHKSAEHEQMARHKSLLHNLNVYLGICVNNHGMINRGLSTLLSYRARCKKSVGGRLNISDVQLYNILLAGYGSAANLVKVREILRIMREDSIAPIPGTYAAVFECLGRMSRGEVNADHGGMIGGGGGGGGSMDVRRLLREYEAEARRASITLNDIMAKSQFVGDQREIVLRAIRILYPAFQPIYTPPATYYENELMHQLNEHLRPLEDVLDPNDGPVNGSEIMMSKNGFDPVELVANAEEQLRIEQHSVIAVKSVERFPEPSEQVLLYRQRLASLHTQWRQQITAAFQRDLNTLRSHTHSKGNRAIGLYPYLRALEADEYVDILMNEARILSEGSETFSLTVGALYKRIGIKVQSKYYMERKRRDGILDKTRRIYADYVHTLCGRYSSDNPRQSWQRHVHHAQSNGPSMNIADQAWPNMTLLGVGRFLFQIMMRDVKIDANVLRANSRTENVLPAFYTLFRNEGKYVKEEVKPHPVLAKLFRGSQQEILHFDANAVPMLCPPQPWSTPQNGGYLLARSDLIRLPNQAHQQWERIAQTNPVHMYPSLDSLNQLSNIAWRVNTSVLDIILEVFSAGGNKKLDVPQPPSSLPPLEDLLGPSPGVKAGDAATAEPPSKTDLYNRFRQKLLHRRKQSEMYSLWCDTLYRLSLANHYRDKVFWLPHNMDFRGRVYPIPPHLNHLGSDLARCLLVFNQARPLGPDGFDWLKLHCINLTGFKKKQAVAERLCYADECLPDILDSADRPLTGRQWWATSDEPWQTLATCVEIARVLRSGVPPADCLSAFPIHQDGSCNGLQHYAALGRDTAGAVSVNLAPCEVPQDVYSDVAGLVEEARRIDAAAGVEVARILEGFIRRAVIKQTVMTTVYGVTRFGARTQIARQLKDIDDFPKDWVWPASTYLTTKTFESLREMFTSTREIQDWFTHCARLISGVGGQNVAWTTPLGLPIVQPYNRFEFSSNPKSNRLSTEQMFIDTHLKPNVMKQKNAFPPNFIHSLDSSHMMLTSLHCEKRGLTFMSVHDCYWTHGCSVAAMNRVCREQFVALHSQPILEDLSEDLATRYGYPERDFSNDGSVLDSTRHKLNRALLQLPGKGDFDLHNVLESVYFFS